MLLTLKLLNLFVMLTSHSYVVEDVFTITGRGTVATGRIERGMVKVGEEIEIVGLGESRKTLVLVLKCFERNWAKAKRG